MPISLGSVVLIVKKVTIARNSKRSFRQMESLVFNVMVYVGEALFVHSRNGREIQHALGERNINISRREIDHLGRRFIGYLALAHEESQEKLRALMSSRGGYILHLDGPCEGDSPHLISTIDEHFKIVLGNVKLPSENADQLIPFLRTIKQAYGNPIASVHDMGAAILKAIKEVFPKIPARICLGTITIQPQRTNNILEQFFRYLKRLGRKRSGNHSLTKTLTTMLAQTPLVKNLDNPQYMEIILNGKTTLAEHFAEIDIVQVRKLFAEEQKVTQKYPKRMADVFKITHLPRRLGVIMPKNASCP